MKLKELVKISEWDLKFKVGFDGDEYLASDASEDVLESEVDNVDVDHEGNAPLAILNKSRLVTTENKLVSKEELVKKYKNKLNEIQKDTDIEVRHSNEDDLLCELLIELGFKEIVDLYNNSDKYMA